MARHWLSQRWLIGGLLVAIGFFLLLMTMGLIERVSIWRFWPLLLVAGGISRLMTRRYAEGFWLLALGVWCQVSLLRVGNFGFGDTWPVLLIAFGIYLIWNAAEKEARRRRLEQRDPSSTEHSS